MGTTDRADAILEALRADAPSAVSGEVLAARLGVSRVAVGKRIAALRAQGYGIEAVGGRGYRLLVAPDLPLPAEVRRLLRSRMWAELKGGGATGSTNDDAKALARAGAAEGMVVLAAEQTAGRGRLGRGWASPAGGVYLSALLRPTLAPPELAAVPLVAGAGVARGLGTLGVEALLKWPNDVFCADGRKLAGILVEMAAESDRADWLVVGVGANVHAPARPIPGACYVDEIAAVPLARVAAAMLDGLADAYAEFLADGFSGALRHEYDARAWLAGRDVTVRDVQGVVRVTGRVAGVDETGRLVVDGPEGAVAVTAGEVTLRPRLLEGAP